MSAGSCLILRQTPRVHFAGSCADLALGNRRIVLGGVAPGTALSFHIEGLLGHAFEAEKPISPPCYLLKGAGGPKQPLLQHGSHVVVPGVVVPTTLDELVPQRFNDFTASIQPVLLEQAGLLAQLTDHEPAPLSTTSKWWNAPVGGMDRVPDFLEFRRERMGELIDKRYAALRTDGTR